MPFGDLLHGLDDRIELLNFIRKLYPFLLELRICNDRMAMSPTKLLMNTKFRIRYGVRMCVFAVDCCESLLSMSLILFVAQCSRRTMCLWLFLFFCIIWIFIYKLVETKPRSLLSIFRHSIGVDGLFISFRSIVMFSLLLLIATTIISELRHCEIAANECNVCIVQLSSVCAFGFCTHRTNWNVDWV